MWMLTILCYVVWCLDVAVPNAEKENTEPLQSPQPGRAHQD